jgi:hypothetical protein
MQLLPASKLMTPERVTRLTAKAPRVRPISAEAEQLPSMEVFPEDSELQDLWNSIVEKDKIYYKVYAAILKGDRSLPAALNLKVNIIECGIDKESRLTYWDRI